MRRRRVAVVGGVLAWMGLSAPAAWAEYQGSNPFQSIAPTVGANDPHLPMNRYTALTIDTHIDAGVTNFGGYAAQGAGFLSGLIWTLNQFLAEAAIAVFTWAFSLNLVGPGSQPMLQVEQVMHRLHSSVFGTSVLLLSFAILGLYAVRQSVLDRRHDATLFTVARSVLYVVLALAVVSNPEATIGRVYGATSTATQKVFSSIATGNQNETTGSAAEAIWESAEWRPWVVLNFGGTVGCVNAQGNPARLTISALRAQGSRTVWSADGLRCSDWEKRVAPVFATLDPNARTGQHCQIGGRVSICTAGTSPRDAAYNALKDGKAPFLPIEKPAADMMQQGGAYYRVGLAILMAVSSVLMTLVILSLSIGVLFAGLAVMLLVLVTPFVLVVAPLPRRGHDFFDAWVRALIVAISLQFISAIVLASLLVVNTILLRAVGEFGLLLGLVIGIVFWGFAWTKRKAILAAFTSFTTGDKPTLFGGDGLSQRLGERMAKRGRAAAGASVGTAAMAVGTATAGGWSLQKRVRLGPAGKPEGSLARVMARVGAAPKPDEQRVWNRAWKQNPAGTRRVAMQEAARHRADPNAVRDPAKSALERLRHGDHLAPPASRPAAGPPPTAPPGPAPGPASAPAPAGSGFSAPGGAPPWVRRR